ncbi:MAG: hypothetical protein GXP62_02110, partial [Oligoflexia bacterium]|nr:hypothetical protein [Oligoflexia bacterium]
MAAFEATGGPLGINKGWEDAAQALAGLVISDDLASICAALDGGEHFAGGALCARQALALFDAHQEFAVGIADLETEQSRDAVTRALAVAALAWCLFQGDASQRASALLSRPAGLCLVGWVAAVELAVAFGSDMDPLSGTRCEDLVAMYGDHAEDALAQQIGPQAARGGRQ